MGRLMMGIILLGVVLSYSLLPTILGKLLWRRGFKARSKKEIILSFDDGPDSHYTKRLLDLLAKEKIRASFFIVTGSAGENRELLYRMREEGHTIGLHSTDHKSLLLKGYGSTKRDLEESLGHMKDLGIDMAYYRPPWGRINIFIYPLLASYGLKMILWSLMAEDWSGGLTSQDIEKRLLKRIGEGSIICLHDGRGDPGAPGRTIEALARLLPRLKEEGYKFITVGDYYD